MRRWRRPGREKRLRLLPSRVVVYFVLALALFEHDSYRQVCARMTASLGALGLARPAVSSLRRPAADGAAPLRRLFATLAGPVAPGRQAGAFWRGWRTVTVDGTLLHVPDDTQITGGTRNAPGSASSSATRCCAWWCWSSAAPVRCLPPRSAPSPPANARTPNAWCTRSTAQCSCWADAGFDAIGFLHAVHTRGAAFLVRSSAARIPTPAGHLPDGSYLARLGYGVLPALLPMRVIVATVTITLADGTRRTESWRLLTSLLDHDRYPAADLLRLYRDRWHAETTYFSIKADDHVVGVGARWKMKLCVQWAMLPSIETTAAEDRITKCQPPLNCLSRRPQGNSKIWTGNM